MFFDKDNQKENKGEGKVNSDDNKEIYIDFFNKMPQSELDIMLQSKLDNSENKNETSKNKAPKEELPNIGSALGIYLLYRNSLYGAYKKFRALDLKTNDKEKKYQLHSEDIKNYNNKAIKEVFKDNDKYKNDSLYQFCVETCADKAVNRWLNGRSVEEKKKKTLKFEVKSYVAYVTDSEYKNKYIIGFMSFYFKENEKTKQKNVYIDHAAVVKKYQKSGVATTLLRHIVTHFPAGTTIEFDTRIFNSPIVKLGEEFKFEMKVNEKDSEKFGYNKNYCHAKITTNQEQIRGHNLAKFKECFSFRDFKKNRDEYQTLTENIKKSF